MALNLSVENVVDSENGYWADLTLEPAKKASKPQNIKKARLPLEDEGDKIKEKLDKAEEHRKEKERQIILKNGQRRERHLVNKEKNWFIKEEMDKQTAYHEAFIRLQEKIFAAANSGDRERVTKLKKRVEKLQVREKKRQKARRKEPLADLTDESAKKASQLQKIKQARFQKKACLPLYDQAVKIKEKLDKAEERRKEKERQIILKNEQRRERYLVNNEVRRRTDR